MISIVYDTSAIYSSSFLIKDYDLINTIFKNNGFLHTTFMTPQVVVDEIVNKLKEEIDRINDDHDDLRKKCSRLLSDNELANIIPNVKILNDELLEKQTKRINKIINNIGEILPYPKKNHSEVVKRALDRRKPFDSKGENGYRDTLIWETIKELCENKLLGSDIVFICQNPRDFFNIEKWKKNEIELDPTLLAELRKSGFDTTKIRCYSSLSRFCDKEILPLLEDLKDISTYILEESFKKKIEPFINDSLLEESDFTNKIEYDFDSVDINYIGLIKINKLLDSRKIDAKTAVIKVECEIEFDIDVYIFKNDYYCNSIFIGSVSDWNDHYFQKNIVEYLYQEILITYDLNNQKIHSVTKNE